MSKLYFVSFVQEAILNSDYAGYVGGRMEVFSPDDEYAIEEIRFFTKDPGFDDFRENWDFSHLDREGLEELRATIKDKYFEELSPANE